MRQKYQDAMAIVRKCGIPDFFITFTCNPNWSEIQLHLNGANYLDRPDICVRVFNIKFKEFRKDLLENHVLGVPTAYVYQVEFQKRGLPHAHMLLTVRTEDKINSVEKLDSVIWAEIPDAAINPRLNELVREAMMHTPCSANQTPCMQRYGTRCSKGFPKAFINDSVLINDGGYPSYRRRDNTANDVAQLRVGHTNQWVVPYNPWLLQKYGCHINVEMCAGIAAIKYIFKYICKGVDMANVRVTNANEDGELQYNEIDAHISIHKLKFL